MARAKAEAIWEAKFKRMRRETFWGVILGLCALLYAGYTIKQKILNPGWDFDAHQWGNPYAIGFAWGTVGILIPVGIFLLFWSGMASRLISEFRGIGVGLILAVIAGLLYGGWEWFYNTRYVVQDEVQQEGWVLGLFTSLVVVSAAKSIYLGVRGEPMWKVRGRVRSKRFVRRSQTQMYTHDEVLDELPMVDDRDNLRIVNSNKRRPGNTP